MVIEIPVFAVWSQTLRDDNVCIFPMPNCQFTKTLYFASIFHRFVFVLKFQTLKWLNKIAFIVL